MIERPSGGVNDFYFWCVASYDSVNWSSKSRWEFEFRNWIWRARFLFVFVCRFKV